ncbi:ThuA domain-containing protein [Solirubrobacter sp. CPCC 204708]|uniref:ThuA domain-containing protein n=2 Tax=Solirubrobacter deserti TaxID=2282478 RepID=A0ABT4REZ2_9ACTN|nr:ThuA domain-containing protein [Solirubrobacter deserti]MDA0137112.1 ThuA domain-containing protein [Solirubrobacter deserti]
MRYALLAVVAAIAWAMAASPARAAQTVVIDAVDSPASAFSPANVSVEVGDTVRWEFDQAQTTHDVTSQGTNWAQPIDEERAPNGEPITRTFNTPGTYTFLCDRHPGMTGSITVQAANLDRVLVFSKTGGFRHDSIPQGIAAIQALGTANNFTVVATEDAAQFTDANLATFDVVVFLSTTGEILNDTQQAAFERYIQGGGGFAGVHAASDTEYSWPWFGELVGGYFRSHPPGTPAAAVDIEDGDEPSTTGLPTRWQRTDEWYNFQHPTTPVVNGNGTVADFSPRARHVKVLATVDESTYDEQDGNAVDDDHPIAWCSDFDGGRSWYTAMGHTQASFNDAQFRQHLLGGLRTAAGVAGDCGRERDVPPTAADFEKVTLSDDTQAPVEIDIAEDGRAFYLERDGRVYMWSPTSQTSQLIADLPVTNSHENGNLGIQLAPDFETTNHIYIAYSALPDASGTNVLSRFTLNGNTLGSEQRIYTWQQQRLQCCHNGGSLDFGPDGSLYISTGDNSNPFAHNYNPADERPGREPWDAQRTSANTNNPNGKILRIKPIPNATGVPGIGTTYTIPEGNMFPESQDTQNKTLPEIYAMGFRNPFRIHVDQKTGWVLLGDYGPDAGAANAARGPAGHVEFNVVKEPGFYGWPYCIGPNLPYRDIVYQSDEGGVGGQYTYDTPDTHNCAAPVNDSPNNNGLTNLPPAIPASTWQTYSTFDQRFPDLGAGGAPMGGPRYYFDADNPSNTKFPPFYDGHWFMGEWNNDWIKTANLNDDGLITGIACFAICQGYQSPMDIEFGPNGSLYVVEWGQGFGSNNADSGVYRIDYIQGARSPIAVANVNNDAVPVGTTVQFSSAGSSDPDGTPISYLWDFNDGTPTSTAANPTHTFTQAGTYNVTLTVRDESGDTAVDTVRVVVGNQRPVVTIEIPENGRVANFGDRIPYKVSVVDPDGGSTGAGTIDCDDVVVKFKLGHDSHAHDLESMTGCQGEYTITGVEGHSTELNIFTVVTASYTDEGNGPAAPVTGEAEAILQPKLKQAEFFSTTGRTADSRAAGGDPGVALEATTDVGGGNSAAFIEDGDWISFNPYNLEDLSKVTFRVASESTGATIELRYDAPDGPLVSSTTFPATGGWQTWADVTSNLPATIPQGTHRLFVVFRHPTNTGGLMNLNWFKFTGKGAAVTAPPEVNATAEPISGEAPLNVAFNADATDAENEAMTYAWDFGVPGTDADKSTEKAPNYTYTTPGNYTASVTVTDASGGRASDTVEVRVTRPLDECPTGPVRSDEFDGTTLDPKWTVLRPDTANPLSVSNGSLVLPISQGSIYGTGTSAKNIVVQDMPDGEWMATAKISASALTENYHQAGLRVYAGDDNWASVHMIYAGSGRDFEFITEVDGAPRNEGADKLGGIPADAPLDYYVRLMYDGENLTAAYSYDGSTFQPVGRPVSLATFTDAKVGPVALSGETATTVPVARFDWVRFDPDGSGGGGSEGIVDNFDGNALDGAWERIRGDQSAVVGSGTLQIPAQTGDIYQTRNDAKNLIVRDAPDGAWQAVTKINFKGTAQYHQAGIMVYGDDNNFTKFGRIVHTTTGTEKFEFINEVNAVARNAAEDSSANLAATFPNDYYLRLTSDGTNVVGHYSTDGSTWTAVGRSAVLPANAKIGLFAFSNDGTGNPVASFDSFALTGDEVGGGGGGGQPSGPSYDDQFDGATLDKERWNAIVRDTPAEYSLAGGKLNYTLSAGDIYTGDTNPPPNNFLLQDASHADEDWVIETKVDGYTFDGGYAQGGLLAYQDGDNYVKFDVITDPNNTVVNRIELRSEIAGVIQEPQSNATVTAAQANGPFWLRLTKEGNSYKGEYSFDGVAWTAAPNSPVTNPMADPDFGLFGFSPQDREVTDTVSFDYFTLNGPDPSGCEQCDGPGDSFDGSSLNADRWNAIAHDDPTKYAVANGALTVTTTAGEIYQGSTGGGPLILQAADHAGSDFVLETKLTNTLDGGYSQGGILVYGDDNNYVKLNAISDDNNANRVNRLELRSEVNGTVSATASDPQITAAQAAGPLWLRLTKAGNSYTAEYKTSEPGSWTAFSGPVTNAMAAPKFGLYTQGVLQSGDTVTFEYFSVDGDSTGCPPVDENEPPTIESASATPSSGFAPLNVQFNVEASDEDDDDLTYSWDFDGDGDSDSTAQNPTHTYTTAGTYEAEVTVSDGEDERTRTVSVTVFGADDPQARFRVLVFSKTTGFRHDSIDEGIAAIKQLGNLHGFQVDATEDASLFRDDVLSRYDTVVWLSTTGDPLNDAQQAAFERYIKAGGGYTGIHAAADTEYDWVWYGRLVGAYFLSHPPGTPPATVKVEDTDHHSTKDVPPTWQRVDEWYNYKSPLFADPNVPDGDFSPRPNVHVLATVDEATYDEQDGNTTDDDHPISWCQRFDGGRSWYTGMGHTAASFSEADFLDHILGGIEVSAGAVADADCGKQGTGNRPPTVTAQRNPSGDVTPGDPVAFTAEGTDPDGDTLTYEWDFGDGASANTQNAMHTYTTPGVWFAKVTVRDGKGGKTEQLLQVNVQPAGGENQEQVGVGGLVPATLALDIRESGNLGVFQPGVGRDYDASVDATVTSTATAAALTVHDPSSTAPGHLVNGADALDQALQVRATDAANPTSAFAPVSGTRRSLLAFPAPVTNHRATVEFRQTIGANETLLRGGYGKVLTFTLSATTP